MKAIASILKQFNVKQRLFVLILILSFTTLGAILNTYFKSTGCEPLIEQNKELVQTIIHIEKMITDYKQIVKEVENDPCLTEGAAAAAVDSAVTGGSSFTEEGYGDPSMAMLDSVLAVTSKVNK